MSRKVDFFHRSLLSTRYSSQQPTDDSSTVNVCERRAREKKFQCNESSRVSPEGNRSEGILLTFLLLRGRFAVDECCNLQDQRLECLLNRHCANLEVFGIPEKEELEGWLGIVRKCEFLPSSCDRAHQRIIFNHCEFFLF
jgi:hypothetical protein